LKILNGMESANISAKDAIPEIKALKSQSIKTD
jgi:hypothetical protein